MTDNKLMENLTIEELTELQRLADIATEKRLAYQKLDQELFASHNPDDASVIPEYTKAKAELTEAVHIYNAYRTALSKKKQSI